MSGLTPMAVYGLEVPAGDIMIPAAMEFPATIRITMAALDPTEDPEPDADGNVPEKGRSTLRIFKQRIGAVEDSDDDDDDEYLKALLANGEDDEEDSEDEDEDDEPNGGPSDPSKSKKARQEAAIKKLLDATQDDDSDEEMDDGDESDSKPNGLKSNKGKAPATGDDEEESDEESESDDGIDLEPYVVCTLDTDRSYQQPLDITIGENEKAFFLVTGTHSVHLTGNYVDTVESDEDEDDEDYDLPPDMEELVGDDDISSDELDEIDDMERIKEVDTDDEEAPPLVPVKKGKKRPASSDAEEGLDDMIAKEQKAAGEVKLSKKQMKKLKNNKGEAVPTKEDEAKSSAKDNATPTKSDKKVQFAKNLEQGPTGSAEKAKSQPGDKGPALGKKVVQGVTMDDKKLGTGRLAKNGDKVSMRYIGKLENGKVFDSNKKGTPFTFKIGKGEVIKGWDVGICGMAVGGERRIIIPASMGYGNKKMDGIPANSTLVFDVKLLEIK